MRNINYYIALLLVMVIASCAEDKGNYDYTLLNDVAIGRFNDGKTFVTSMGKTVSIEPNLTYRLDDRPEDFTYLWIIGADTVSTERNLEYVIPDGTPYGSTSCSYTVVNKLNGMKYFRSFSINVVNPFNWGYYILTKSSDNSTEVAFLSSEEDAEFISTSKIGHCELGNDPTLITGEFGMINVLDDYYWTLYVSTKEGDYPTIVTECATFLPNKTITQNSFIDQQVRRYAPEKMYISPWGDVYILSDGKIVRQVSGYLYRPAAHDKDYYWSEISCNTQGVCVLDKLSNKFNIAIPTPYNPETGLSGDPLAYDTVLPVADCADFSNSKIIDLFVDWYKTYANNNHIIASVSDKGIAIDTVVYDFTNGNAYFRKGVLITGAPVSKSSCGTRVNETDWYFGIENQVYSSPDILHKLTHFYTIPDGFGDIIEIRPSVKNSTLAITTYNSSSKKGSFILLDIQSKAAKTYKDVMNEPVSLFCADDNPWW